ncbi:MAG TPA: MBOAT family O-acyltransferase, partial [Puia sp.]|nr:MBOAT family O-acyltransferase [Puia sp.]
LYVMFYPQLVAGPIERPQNLLHQFREHHEADPALIGSGLRLMAWGYFKKMVVADHLAVYVDKVFGNPTAFHGFPVIAAILFFSFQIYCDFSGYSDIARGTARVMGIQLMRNFNFPYFASSIREFWTRWHISLSTWFRDYLYIPLGGNRVSAGRWCFNIMLVFMLSGLWHGANWTFLVWGALHGLYMIAEYLKQRRTNTHGKYRPLAQMSFSGFLRLSLVFLLVSFGWIFFRAKNMDQAFELIKNCTAGYHFFHPGLTTGIVSSFGFYTCVLGILALTGMEILLRFKNFRLRFMNWSSHYRVACYIMLCLTIVSLGVFNHYRFIYFQF